MRTSVHIRFASIVSCVWLLACEPAAAQVHQYVAADATPRFFAVPPNIVVSPSLRGLVDRMLRESRTFRRQCLRIAADASVTVHLNLALVPLSFGVRAKTRFSRPSQGPLSAAIEIGRRENLVELIAHEFEHVIEQLDGVDLHARATVPGSGVSEVSFTKGVFETIRATRAGLSVVAELPCASSHSCWR